jgi:prephenate dehydratase
MACKCEKQEVGQGNGGVKGFITTQECEECKSAREAANLIAEAQRTEQAVVAEKEALVQAKMRELAEKELVIDGKLSEAGELIKEDI